MSRVSCLVKQSQHNRVPIPPLHFMSESLPESLQQLLATSRSLYMCLCVGLCKARRADRHEVRPSEKGAKRPGGRNGILDSEALDPVPIFCLVSVFLKATEARTPLLPPNMSVPPCTYCISISPDVSFYILFSLYLYSTPTSLQRNPLKSL